MIILMIGWKEFYFKDIDKKNYDKVLLAKAKFFYNFNFNSEVFTISIPL